MVDSSSVTKFWLKFLFQFSEIGFNEDRLKHSNHEKKQNFEETIANQKKKDHLYIDLLTD